MTKARTATSRPYLRAAQRREQLLAAAADLVGKRGWSALGIVPLAAAAGVSRQLVYEHFADTSDLLASMLRYLFEGARAATAEILSEESGDLGGVIRRAYEVYLALPRAQRRALRALAGDSDPNSAEFDRARHLMRHEILGLWAPYVRRHTGLNEAKSRALAWMLTAASWAITDLVEDGTLSSAGATAMLSQVVTGAVAAMGEANGQRGVSRSAAPRSRKRRV